jgi:hypothetical protein
VRSIHSTSELARHVPLPRFKESIRAPNLFKCLKMSSSSRPRTTKDDPAFLDNFFKQSRLHFIGNKASILLTLGFHTECAWVKCGYIL